MPVAAVVNGLANVITSGGAVLTLLPLSETFAELMGGTFTFDKVPVKLMAIVDPLGPADTTVFPGPSGATWRFKSA